jgi:hypothetical protein
LVAALLAFSIVAVAACSGAGASGIRRVGADEGRVGVQFFGDSLALTLGIALGAPTLESKYDYKSWDGGILGCGVAVGSPLEVSGVVGITAPACRQTTPIPDASFNNLPWPTQWQHWLSLHHPNVAVLLAGRWEMTNRVYNGQWTNILEPAFASYVKGQLELASNLVTASGANMVFLTAPCVKQTLGANGLPWPEEDANRLNAYNQLVREVAAEHPKTDSVVDLNAVVCPGGHFSATYKGVTVRQPDGVHFTIGSGTVLAHPVLSKILASGRAQMKRLAKQKSAK